MAETSLAEDPPYFIPILNIFCFLEPSEVLEIEHVNVSLVASRGEVTVPYCPVGEVHVIHFGQHALRKILRFFIFVQLTLKDNIILAAVIGVIHLGRSVSAVGCIIVVNVHADEGLVVLCTRPVDHFVVYGHN